MVVIVTPIREGGSDVRPGSIVAKKNMRVDGDGRLGLFRVVKMVKVGSKVMERHGRK